jgi:methylphosphotriester-DNA--protein-cysteine methyltransferase
LKIVDHQNINNSHLFNLLKNRSLTFAGNKKLKIYGTLRCKSGKRMKKENRVFFLNEEEAIATGFRPCGHCMAANYLKWRMSKKQVEEFDER